MGKHEVPGLRVPESEEVLNTHTSDTYTPIHRTCMCKFMHTHIKYIHLYKYMEGMCKHAFVCTFVRMHMYIYIHICSLSGENQ